MKLYPKIIIMLFYLCLPFHISLYADSFEGYEINIDLNNDENMDLVFTSPCSLKIHRAENDGIFASPNEIMIEEVRLSRFNQYDFISSRSEVIFGHDVASVFNLNSDIGRMRYNSIQNRFSRDKFLFIDINKDNLYDLTRIEEPTAERHGIYRHVIHYQREDCSFSNTVDKVVETKFSSWITGIYFDINKDGFLDKIELRYKSYGTLLSSTKCIISIFLMDIATEKYNDKPDIRIISKGFFENNVNFRDIDDNGYPDLVILDFPKRPKSFSDLISKILDKDIEGVLKFYLYKDGGYPKQPSFMKKINIDMLSDLFLSLDSDFNNDGYKDLLVQQPNCVRRYIFNKEKLKFSDIEYK